MDGDNREIILKGSAKSVIVGYSDIRNIMSDSNPAILIVGKENAKKQIEIINAIQGEDAKTLWEMLTVKEDK